MEMNWTIKSFWYKLFGFPEFYVVETEYGKLWNVPVDVLNHGHFTKNEYRLMTNQEILEQME